MNEKEFEEAVKTLHEISSTEVTRQLGAEDEKIVFIGRPTCPYCREYLPKLIDVVKKDNLDVYYVNSIDADDEVLNEFRFKVGAKTVPSTLRVGGSGEYENFNLESSASNDDIRSKISNA